MINLKQFYIINKLILSFALHQHDLNVCEPIIFGYSIFIQIWHLLLQSGNIKFKLKIFKDETSNKRIETSPQVWINDEDG